MIENRLPLLDAPGAQPPSAPKSKGTESTAIRDALNFLNRRKRVVWPAFIITIMLGVLITSLLIPVWTSEAKLVVVTQSASAVGSQSGAADVLSTLDFLTGGRTVDTQAEIVNSPDILYPAFAKLTKKERIDGFNPQYLDIPPDWSYNIVSKLDTDVIVITTKARRASIAAKWGNLIAETYLSQNLAWNKAATSQAVGYIDKEQKQISADLAEATEKLAAYQKQTNLSDAFDQVSETAKAFVAAQNDLRTANADASASHSRLNFLASQLKGVPSEINFQRTISENPEVTLVRGEIVQAEDQLARDRQEYAPTSTKIKTDLAALKIDQDKLKQLALNLVTAKTVQVNPLQQKLLGDFADATAVSMVYDDHSRALQQEVDKLQAQMQAFPEQQRKLSQLQLKVDVLSRTENNLSDRYFSLLIQKEASLPEGILAETARPSHERSSPRWGLSLAFTLVFAVLIAFSAAWIVDGLDTKIHNMEALEEVTGLPILSVVPAVTSSSAATMTIGNVEPSHAFLESFRLFRNNIRFASIDRDVKTLAITSSMKGEGKSTVCQNLGIVAALDQIRILVVDCDLRRPSVHKKFGIESNLGFTGAVTSNLEISECVQATQWENVYALTSGPLTPNPTEFLNAEKTRRFLKSLEDHYDLVLLDSPPCMGLSDMQIISTIADAVVLVTGLEDTQRQILASSVHMLRQASANLLGVVVNRAKKNSSSYYGYYGYYSYYSYEQDDSDTKKKRRRKKSGGGG